MEELKKLLIRQHKEYRHRMNYLERRLRWSLFHELMRRLG